MKKLFVITLAACIFLSGCASNESGVSVPTIAVTPESSPDVTSAPAYSSSAVQIVSTTSEESSEPPIVYDPDVRFVTFDKYAKTAPYPDAERSRFYAAGMLVRVASEEPTDTGYFELNNGDFIRAECISKPDEVNNFYYQRVQGGLPKEPPEETPDYPPYYGDEPLIYNRYDCLQYAAEHWAIDECFCAEFASECLTAGGLKYDLASSTTLYNELIASGLGYAVAFELNEEGLAELPYYVTPGDVVFYYCPAENLMVHTTIYNGESEDGYMAAFSHNPRGNGADNCKYYKACPGGCGCPLTTVVAFCFYEFY